MPKTYHKFTMPVSGKAPEKERALLEKNLTRLFEKYIVLRDKNTCVLTGSRQRLVTPCYFWDRPALRWDERVAHCLVERERILFRNEDCTKYYEWMVKAYGQGEFLEMQAQARRNEKVYKMETILELLDKYGKLYQGLKGVI